MSNQDKKLGFTIHDKRKCFLLLNSIMKEKELLSKAESIEITPIRSMPELQELREKNKHSQMIFHHEIISLYKNELFRTIDKI